LSDDNPYNPNAPTVISGDTTWNYDQTFTCSDDRADYGTDGMYSINVPNTATLNDNINLSDTENVVVTCYASFVDILKTTNDVVDPTKDIRFRLYDAAGTYLDDEVSTFEDEDGRLPFQTALVPGDSYTTICESPVPAGYTFEISVNGGNVLTYAGPPGAPDPTGEIQCFDFTAAAPQTTLTFEVNNSYPGGAPRTPGYWKNWSTCSGGNQAETAAKLGGVEEGVFLLDGLLPQTLGDYLTIDSCEDGVAILSAQTLGGENQANDAAYTLARALLAARLNQDAGACVPLFDEPYVYDPKKGDTITLNTFEEVLTAADGVLSEVEFDGTGDYLGPKNKEQRDLAAYALWLYEIIDDYNNSEVCTGEPSH
jgi:hypothetical protein